MACGLGLGAPSAEARPDLIYVALGASDAVGIGADPITRGYVYRIRSALDDLYGTVYLVILAVPGWQLADIERALRIFNLSGQRPHLVTLWAGPNDLIRGNDVERFEATLASILRRVKRRSSTVIAVANIPDLLVLPRFVERPDPDVTAERIDAFNAAIERQVAAAGVLLVDIAGEDIDLDWVSDEDGFHPNNEGYAMLAQAFLEVVLPALAGPAALPAPSPAPEPVEEVVEETLAEDVPEATVSGGGLLDQAGSLLRRVRRAIGL